DGGGKGARARPQASAGGPRFSLRRGLRRRAPGGVRTALARRGPRRLDPLRPSGLGRAGLVAPRPGARRMGARRSARALSLRSEYLGTAGSRRLHRSRRRSLANAVAERRVGGGPWGAAADPLANTRKLRSQSDRRHNADHTRTEPPPT